MSANPRGFVVLAADQIGQDGRQWIEVMPTVTEAKNGPWLFTITADDLETYAQSIRDNPGKTPVDYDHEGAIDGGSTRAAGWFTGQATVEDTADRGPILRAEVQWTPAAAQAIRDGEFKMISPEFDFHEKDAKTGLLSKARTLIAATLTNRPFFKQLTPVAADLDNDSREALAAALGLDPGDVVRLAQWTGSYVNSLPDSAFLYIEDGGAKDSDGKTKPRSLRHFPVRDDGGNIDLPHLRNALARIPQSSLPADVKQRLTTKARRLLSSNGGASASIEGEIMPETLKALAAALGLPEDATEEQVTEAATAAKAAADETTAVKAELDKVKAASVDETRIGKLEAELAAEKKLRLDDRRESILAKAVEDRRIDPATKTILAEQFGDNIDGLEKVVATYQPKPAGARGGSGPGREGAAPDDVALAASEFEYDNEAGRTMTARDGELELHVKAEKILADRGKHTYTAEEYASAYAEAERAPVAA